MNKIIAIFTLLLATSIAHAQILIFISSSMPIESVAQWMNEARTHGNTALVMNGLVNNSLKDTKAWVDQVVKASKGKGGVSIDPRLFDRYHITQVPAVVNHNQVVYGNVSLATALEAMHG